MADGLLDGKRIVITGAGSGLGAAYATAVAAAGAAVVVNDIDLAAATAVAGQIAASGGRATAIAGDVARWDDAEAAIRHCVDELGGIDAVVNNAGVIEHKHMLEETEQESRWMVEVNVLGTIFIATHAARAMVAAGTRGTIVNVSSGNQAGHSYHATYGATKGAVSTLTYAWARDLDEHGITVNAISPNAPTGQVQKLIATFGRNTEHAVLPEPEDNAAVVVFLLSDRARHLNGQIVRLEHGRLNVMGHPVAVHPRVEMASWTVDDVERAFADTLNANLQPLGLCEARIEHVETIL